ncbi:unnamed protein product [Owenia fusiformis]|uniref:Uncharacterized protein n=1 Tax=Owenia fusiformis TaxID=6347 RepID=A0A8J1XR14_OWEFU|nr:unnamed protein product [Owenia fusiformis]
MNGQSSGEEEEVGPSVDSTDHEERIAARRLRIQKRVEAAKRAAMGEDLSEKKEVKEELSKSRKQIEGSRLRLTKLKRDGTELVTNIRVAGDARENSRRIEEEDARRQRREKLEAEAKAGSERFEEITKKWESALQKEIPQDLHEMLKQQKGSCDAMIDEKNKLINDFQMELKQKDDQYVKDLKKQAEDIDLMIERMEEQYKNLNKAYREELNQIERAFVSERNELLDVQKKRWETNMEGRRDKEVDFMTQRDTRVDDYEQQLQHLRIQDAEEYNMVKIKLETDVQILEQQLQQMRATYQLNTEKLEYNFQVLKKRDEENTITKSQQKRKITRMQDVLTNMRTKLAKQEKAYKDENTQLTEDYKRITEQFKELQKKSKHFMGTDAKKFHDVWLMNEEEVKEFLNKVLETDMIIHQQQLGLQWAKPDTTFTENVGPLQSKKDRGLSASQIIQEVMSATMSEKDDGSESGDGAMKSGIVSKLSPQVIKSILELLCDESGFLVESKLNKLLAPLDRDEQSLMKLDAIFSALGVETEDDIHLLAKYFMLLEEQKQQGKTSTEPQETEDGPLAASQSVSGKEAGLPRGTPQSSMRDGESQAGEFEDIDDELRRVLDKEEAGSTPRSLRSGGGTDLIHPNEVTKALRQFVEDNRKQPKSNKIAAQFKITGAEDRDDKNDTQYWEQYPQVVTKGKERLWDALVEGLEKYSDTLTARSNLIKETDGLRQQNAELRMLLHQYVHSKVNQELEIPPTRVLQLEMNPH